MVKLSKRKSIKHKSKKQYGCKRLSRTIRKKIQRIKISRKKSVKHGGSAGPRVTQIPTGPLSNPKYSQEDTGWNFEENPADGACFYWSVLRGMNRLVAKGSYQIPGRAPGIGFLGESAIQNHNDSLLNKNLGHVSSEEKDLFNRNIIIDPEQKNIYLKQEKELNKLGLSKNEKTIILSNLNLNLKYKVPSNKFGDMYCIDIDMLGNIKPNRDAILQLRNILAIDKRFTGPNDSWAYNNQSGDQKDHLTDWAENEHIQVFADIFNICICVWQLNENRGQWDIFIPNRTKAQNPLTQIYTDGNLEVTDVNISNIEYCRNILYLYNATQGHYFLIEPKETQPSRVNTTQRRRVNASMSGLNTRKSSKVNTRKSSKGKTPPSYEYLMKKRRPVVAPQPGVALREPSKFVRRPTKTSTFTSETPSRTGTNKSRSSKRTLRRTTEEEFGDFFRAEDFDHSPGGNEYGNFLGANDFGPFVRADSLSQNNFGPLTPSKIEAQKRELEEISKKRQQIESNAKLAKSFQGL